MRILADDLDKPSCSLQAGLQFDGDPQDFFFHSEPPARLTANSESLLTAALLPCMKTGESIHLNSDVSAKFLESLNTIQDTYCGWDPTLKRVEITGLRPVAQAPSPQQGVGTFFSGGVDSFYTLLKHREEITDLVFVHGFDIRLDDRALRREVSWRVRDVAAQFGKRLIEIETDLRPLLDKYVRWGPLGHGAALASVGHLLYPLLGRIYIPSTHAYKNLFPWGTHPDLDPLWSSEGLAFIHDGCEAVRLEKTRVITGNDTALRHLRVCYKNPNSAYNCGQCEKCLRTMISLKVNNALDRSPTFPNTIDLNILRTMPAQCAGVRILIRENYEALKATGMDRKLEKALEKLLKKIPPGEERPGLRNVLKRWKMLRR